MIKIFKTRDDAIMPRRGTEGAAGYDVFTTHDFDLRVGERKRISIGIATQFPPCVQCQIWPRSGLGFKNGVDRLAGLIDSDYTGEIGVVLINHGDQDLIFKAGDAIAQMVFAPVLHDVEEGDYKEIGHTARGSNGYGSTDEIKKEKL